LVAFYSAHDPTKVSRVDEFLSKYHGREEAMWAKLEAKYGGGEGVGDGEHR